jgi:hypothetical protein
MTTTGSISKTYDQEKIYPKSMHNMLPFIWSSRIGKLIYGNRNQELMLKENKTDF